MKKLLLMLLTGVALSSLGTLSLAAGNKMTGKSSEWTRDIPADVVQFTKDFSEAMKSGDVDRVVPFYSPRFLHDGRNRKTHKMQLALMVMNVSRFEIHITSMKPINKNRAFITAEMTSSVGEDTKKPDYQIVREHGKWRWLGNQRKSANPS